MDHRIRLAAVDDLPALALMKAEAWRESYTGLLEATVIDAQFADQAVQRIVEHWARGLQRGVYLWIAEDVGTQRFVGMACADAADGPTTLELQAIYLRDEAKGTGLGDGLLRTSIGDAPAHLWVLKGNNRAIRFYERHGFTSRPDVRDPRDPRHLLMVRGEAA